MFGYGKLIIKSFTIVSAILILYFITFSLDDYICITATSAAFLEALSLWGVAKLRIRDAYDLSL